MTIKIDLLDRSASIYDIVRKMNELIRGFEELQKEFEKLKQTKLG